MRTKKPNQKVNKMKRTAILTVILLAALNLSGYAQETEHLKPKSKGTATAAAISGIVVPVVGPGLGHMYAGQTGQFTTGVVIRGVCAVVGVTGIMFMQQQSDQFVSPGQIAGFAVSVVSGAVYLISSIHDIATSAKAVEKYNREHGFTSIRLRPYYNPDRKFVGLDICAGF